jgi:hypothetical protein
MSNELPQVPALERPVANPAVIDPQNAYVLAVVIDNVVYQVMHTNAKSASIYLANPIFVQIAAGDAQEGYTYDPETNTFSA